MKRAFVLFLVVLSCLGTHYRVYATIHEETDWRTGLTFSYDDASDWPWATIIGKGNYNISGNEYKLEIPDKVSIGSGSTLYTVNAIAESAFAGLKSETELSFKLDLPDTLNVIGDSAFKGSAVQQINFPGGSGSGNGITIGDSAFEDCTQLSGTLTIPDSVTSIGNSAFKGCNSLGEVHIGDKVTTIGDSAFEGLDWVDTLYIGDSVTTIGKSAFKGCTAYSFNGSYNYLRLPDSVTDIGDSAFADMDNLYGISLPKGVKSIGSDIIPNGTELYTYASTYDIFNQKIN